MPEWLQYSEKSNVLMQWLYCCQTALIYMSV